MDRILRFHDIRDRLGNPGADLIDLIRNHGLPVHRLDGRFVAYESELESWIENKPAKLPKAS